MGRPVGRVLQSMLLNPGGFSLRVGIAAVLLFMTVRSLRIRFTRTDVGLVNHRQPSCNFHRRFATPRDFGGPTHPRVRPKTGFTRGYNAPPHPRRQRAAAIRTATVRERPERPPVPARVRNPNRDRKGAAPQEHVCHVSICDASRAQCLASILRWRTS